MPEWLGWVIGVVGFAVSIATFFIGRQTAAKNSGQEWGELKTDMKYVKQAVEKIEISVSENSRAAIAAVMREEAERKEADRRLHTRIDEHIAQFHNSSK